MSRADPDEPQPGETGVDPRLAAHGLLSYLEIPAVDARSSAVFYREVFGWNVRALDASKPGFGDPAGRLIGRRVTGRTVSSEPGFFPYLYVDGIQEVVKRVLEQGGKVVEPPSAEGNLWDARIRDPAGNLVGIWQQCQGRSWKSGVS
jgi:predicted enzyme related to lactoylglutathione lyase